MNSNDTQGPIEAIVQGNVLRGIAHEHARFVYLKILDAKAARTWLYSISPQISRYGDEGNPSLTIAFAHSGLAALGVRADLLAGRTGKPPRPPFSRPVPDSRRQFGIG